MNINIPIIHSIFDSDYQVLRDAKLNLQMRLVNSTVPVNYQWWNLRGSKKMLRNRKFPASDAIINIDTINFTDSEKQSIKSLQFQEIYKQSHRHPCAIDDSLGSTLSIYAC